LREALRGQPVQAARVERVRAELDAGVQFGQIVDDLVEVNEAICKQEARGRVPTGPQGQKKGGPETM
jgi:hypothetical protein